MAIQSFVEEARSWTSRLRRCLDERDASRLADLVASYGGLERRARLAIAQLKGGAVEAEERDALLAELRRLGRMAHVAAALADSEALYLRWGQTTARPAAAYTARGEAATDRPPSKRWEA